MSTRRALFLGWILLAALKPAHSLAQYPYDAVTNARVKVRSGPSENHYATGILERDAHVRVVGEQPNGWLAIEPPEGSFCWISGEFVREISETEGEVTGDNVLVRIGTPQDERLRDSWQKKLNRGDRVRVLDKKTTGQGPLAKLSYKIAPPRGEVRYVSSQFVRPASGTRTDRRTGTADGGAGRRREEPDTASPDSRGPGDYVAESDTGPPGLTSPVEAESTAATAKPGTPLERADEAYKAMLQQELPQRNVAKVRTLYEQAAQTARSEREHDHIARQLEILQAQEARKNKFEEFDRLVRSSRQRDEALLAMSTKKDRPAEPPSQKPKESPPARFDGGGILRRSTMIIDGKPAYVLLGPQGGIRYYITPSPGIDLNKYLDQLVAVRGPTSYRVEVRAQHITVRDITTIELSRESGKN